jgi:hypothetical protein
LAKEISVTFRSAPYKLFFSRGALLPNECALKSIVSAELFEVQNLIKDVQNLVKDVQNLIKDV